MVLAKKHVPIVKKRMSISYLSQSSTIPPQPRVPVYWQECQEVEEPNEKGTAVILSEEIE
jgi:hypothetical protein